MSEKREAIDPLKFKTDVFKLFNNDWLLLTSGDAKKFNAMTIAWGSLGVMWGKPFAMVVLRPQRYTLEFLKKSSSFTLSAFPESCRKALSLCGAKSGRDCDKIKLAGLTPLPSTKIEAPGFDEAELIIECKKTYDGGALDPKGFVFKETAKEIYPTGDFHQIFFGEIVAIQGTAKHRS